MIYYKTFKQLTKTGDNMTQIVETVPFNYQEIREEIDSQFQNEGYDTSYGSNVSQLSNIMAYVASMLNVNTALNINETILSYATKRENVLEVARNFSYEAQKTRSYIYDVDLVLGPGKHVIPQWTEFTGGGHTYYMVSNEINLEVPEGETQTVTAMVKEGTRYTYQDDPGSLTTTISTLTENGQTVTQYYMDIPYMNVEQEGLEVFCSYYDEYGLYHDKIKFQERTNLFIEGGDNLNGEYIRIDNTEYKTPRIYFKYAGSGTGLPEGSDVFVNVLVTSGTDGSLGSLSSATLTCSVAGVQCTNIHLASAGQGEESINNIKTNAPIIYNSSNRLVVADDYRGACNKDTRIHDSIIWGGEKEFPKSPGHIWFSFIPSLEVKKYSSDELNTVYERESSDFEWDYSLPSDEYEVNNQKANEYYNANYLSGSVIRSTSYDKNGNLINPGIWDNIDTLSIPTLVYHHRHPVFCEFNYEIDVLKYSIYENQPAVRQEIFDIINNAFKGNDSVEYEKFEVEYFNASIIKRIQNRVTDISGFKLQCLNRLVLNRRTLVLENQNPDYRDVYIPLHVPYEDYFDADGFLKPEILPSIDTEEFVRYIPDYEAYSKADIFTDWSWLQAEREKGVIQSTQSLIVAPIRIKHQFRYDVGMNVELKVIPLPFRIYPDQYSTRESSEYTYDNCIVYMRDTEKEPVESDRLEFNENFGWYNNLEHPARVYIGNNVELKETTYFEIIYNGNCGFYYLFNSYTKEILIHLFVDASVSGYRDELLAGGGVDDSMDQEECYLYTIDDYYLNTNNDFYLYTEAQLEPNQKYVELANFIPKARLTFSENINGPMSYLYSLDSKYLYTNDKYYLTTNGYIQTSDEENSYTGPIVKDINENMYLWSSLKADLFYKNRYLNLKYGSPNFQVIRNVIPYLRKVEFKSIEERLNA